MSPFHIRGVVEGFYGVFYTAPEREDLIRFIGQHGYNFYLYGPKNDRQHRARWREPYPAKTIEQFKRTVATAHEVGVTFGFSLSPGVSMCYASDEDFDAITCKYRTFYDVGVRAFSILLDDITPEFQHEADDKRYKSYAEAHADLCNRLYQWLKRLDADCTLSMCPTDYHGSAPFSSYIHELGMKLHPDIDIFYTGRAICSTTISSADAEAFAKAVQRPPLIWDNCPVNDLAMQSELHIGPIRGRDPSLHKTIKGVLINPMIQAEASKIPLLTYADYLAQPENYDPEVSWDKSLQVVGGEESASALRLLAENSLHSCLGTPDAEKLESLVNAVLTSLLQGYCVHDNPEVDALDAYFNELDEATYHLKFRMENLGLRNNLLPWIELLEHWLWMGRRALIVLRAIESGDSYQQPLHMMTENLEDAQKHHKRIAGKVLLPLAQYVWQQIGQQQKVAQDGIGI